MNKRIQELAQQTCCIWRDSGDTQTYEFTPEKLEKFAKLILRECTDVLMQRHEESKHSHNYYHVTANMLKKRFEVKE